MKEGPAEGACKHSTSPSAAAFLSIFSSILYILIIIYWALL
ncbi:MAG: hypothetical protein QXR92_00850 [Fervidicoccaceae archaeon]